MNGLGLGVDHVYPALPLYSGINSALGYGQSIRPDESGGSHLPRERPGLKH
jgi:hypothetical protein